MESCLASILSEIFSLDARKYFCLIFSILVYLWVSAEVFLFCFKVFSHISKFSRIFCLPLTRQILINNSRPFHWNYLRQYCIFFESSEVPSDPLLFPLTTAPRNDFFPSPFLGFTRFESWERRKDWPDLVPNADLWDKWGTALVFDKDWLR